MTHHSKLSGSSTEAVTPMADTLPFPVTAGIAESGTSITVYADTASAGTWWLEIYDNEGTRWVLEPVKPRTYTDYIMNFGGWHDIYLLNTATNHEVYVDSFDIEQSIERVYGGSRFETSAATSANSFRRGVPVAYVANGLNFPDALSGAAAAGHLGGPVLLTRPDVLPDAIKTELERLAPKKIIVLGGSDVVSNTVKTALAAYTSGTVQRIGGASRFDTSALISANAFKPGVPVAYVANGLNFPDALSGAAAGGKKGGPVLLTMPGELPSVIAAELQRLQPAKIVVLGGSDVVSSAVKTQLASYTTGTVTRLAGPTRFDTSVAISAASFSPNVPVAYIANAFNFPDALSGAAAAGMLGGPVLLSRAGSLEQSVKAELDRLNPSRIVVLGGPDVIGDYLMQVQLPPHSHSILASHTPGSYETASGGTAGPTISNVVISANELAVTVSFDYVHPAGWWTPVYVGIYPGTPATYPYGNFSNFGDYGLADEWSAWMWMPDGATSGHASQSFPIYTKGPLTVMLFGSQPCQCSGGTDFLMGRDFAAIP